MSRLPAVLARLKVLHPKAIDLSLGRTLTLLERLGRPQDRLPPVVHVAGTNGKGSVIAFMRAILEAAGRRCHVYTSPHLVRFNERIVVAGAEMDDDSLIAVLKDCEAANHGDPITFFEITTAAAFLAFARQPADVVLLETGLGGRFDSTNVVDRPALTVITPVSLDHQGFLGETLAEIAREKAGILKKGVPCVMASQERQAHRTIETVAGEVGAPLVEEGRDWFIQTAPDGLIYRFGTLSRRLPAPGLAGGHQIRNAALAVAAVDEVPGIEVPDSVVARGVAEARWPARLQRLTTGPLAARLPKGWELWLDGGHNPAAGAALARQARQWRDRPLFLVVGMLGTKDSQGFLKPFAGRVRSLRMVPIPGESGAADPAALAGQASAMAMPAATAATVAGALDDLADAGAGLGPARVLICGSLYLAGTVLAQSDTARNS